MKNAIVRTFTELATAEQARDELLLAGFSPDGVELTVRSDETGAVQGNFTVGDRPAVKGGTDYKDTFAPTHQQAVRDCMVTVSAADPAQADRAAAILDRFGALDPDSAHRPANRRAGG